MSGAGPELKKALNQRQLTMIAMGGVIGAGLFVGSGTVIHATGPAAFLTYALCGVLIILVMRMLAEMAVANPSTGSFADYSRKALGDWAGFSVGWLYWYFWVIVVGFEAVAGAKVINFWLPGVPTWVLSLVLMLLMTGTNLISVSSFGEFEFWFAGIKVARDHRLPRLRRAVRPRDLAQRRPRLQQPHRARRLLPQRRAGGHGRGRDGHLLDGGRRDRDHRRSRVRQPRAGRLQGRQLGHHPHRDLLRGLDLPARRHPAVELRHARGVALRRGVPGDGHPVRRPT